MSANKFRAWDKKNKRMWSPEELQAADWLIDPLSGNLVLGSSKDVMKDFLVLEPLRFTGLKDSYIQEIWEGDIIRFWVKDCAYIGDPPSELFVVEYDQFGLKDSRFGFHKVFTYYQPEVVGNIFENPELLTNKRG